MVKPLGLFEPGVGQGFDLDPESLRAVAGGLSLELRPLVAQYLRSGATVIALMEYTYDVLEGRFGVPGGTGIDSDGTYYWRADMAAYIECYGFGVSKEALAHMEAHAWRAPTLSKDEVSEIWDVLGTVLRRREARPYLHDG